MEKLKKVFTSIWIDEIKDRFDNGFIIYERQLQAELYRRLKEKLKESDNYEVWVEPVLYNIFPPGHIIKPDIIITKADLIVGIVEIKFKPWEEVNLKYDFNKLMEINRKLKKIKLRYKPFSSDWKKQNKNETSEYMLVEESCLNIFIAFGKENSPALDKIEGRPENFLHLIGYIDNSKHASKFGINE